MYALLALGFTLVYGIIELINFAHFNVFMVGSFIGMWALELLGADRASASVLTGLPLVGVLLLSRFVVTMLGAGVLGVAIERIALRPLRDVPGTGGDDHDDRRLLHPVQHHPADASAPTRKNFPNPMPTVALADRRRRCCACARC